jgi:hypothetical protein
MKVHAIYKPKIMKTKTRGFKDLTVITDAGTVIDFGEQVAAPEDIKVGMEATIEGVPADGDYVMPNGATWKFENGILTEKGLPPDLLMGPNVFGDPVVYMIYKGRFLVRAEPSRSPGKPIMGV